MAASLVPPTLPPGKKGEVLPLSLPSHQILGSPAGGETPVTSHPPCRYGDEFIQEAYLYHITRRDTKHNFSVYFYMLSLIEGTWLSSPVGILAFLPQAVLLLVAALWLYRDITFCCFVQTFTFVTFNKVCTSQVSHVASVQQMPCYVYTVLPIQYFLWYLCLLPLILPFTQLRFLDGVVMATLWFICQVSEASVVSLV